MSRQFINHSPIKPSCILLALFFCCSAVAQDPATDRWRSSLSIYGWFAGIDGTLNFEVPGGGGIGVDSGDVISALDGGFMGTFRVSNKKWSVLADLIYLKLSDDKSTSIDLPNDNSITARTNLEVKGLQFALYGGYSVYQTSKASMEAILGVRYLNIDSDAEFNISGPLPPELPSRRLSRSKDLWDGVVGIRGRANFNEKWFLPYHFDIGAGSSDLTWQALAGVGYQFNWGDIILAYRHLSWDTGNNGAVKDLSFSGPGLGVRFNF